MEDRRAEPRNKPPQLETNGLYDKPTLVSNVETFAWVPSIVVHGGAWYRDLGVNGAKGLRFFSISGDVNRPGVYEVPMRHHARATLIDDLPAGMRDGQELKAFAPSGPSGGFLPAGCPDATARRLRDAARGTRTRAASRGDPPAGPSEFDILDLELDLQTMREMGLMLGAGMVVYGDRANMLDQALNASTFFRNESCGKCVPCRLGSQKLVEMAGGLLQWQYDEESVRPVEKLLDGLATDDGDDLDLRTRHGGGEPPDQHLPPLPAGPRTLPADARSSAPSPTSRRSGGPMSDLSGLLAPKGTIPTHQDTMSDFEILGDPDHE